MTLEQAVRFTARYYAGRDIRERLGAICEEWLRQNPSEEPPRPPAGAPKPGERRVRETGDVFVARRLYMDHRDRWHVVVVWEESGAVDRLSLDRWLSLRRAELPKW